MASRALALAAVFSLLPVVSTVFADDAPPPPPQGWSGKGQAGYVMSRGTTDTDTANAKIDLSDTIDDTWKHLIHFEGLYGRSSSVTTAERWAANLQSNYLFTPRAYVFGAFDYLEDYFSGFQYQGDVAAGLGYKFLDTAHDRLSAQAGVGYRRLRPELLVLNAEGAVIGRTPLESQGSVIGTAGFSYEHDFNASTKIADKYLINSGAGNTEMQNDLALVVNMSKKLALSVGYTFQENSSPPAGLPKVTTLTTLNLVYAFNPP
jgi:putative salt-induced outer membrane protein YdiY